MSSIDFGGRGSSGYNFGGGRSRTSLSFERDLARVRARQLRNRNLNLRARQKESGSGWFLDPVIPDIVETAADQIATSLINTPAGAYHMLKGTALDIRDLGQGDYTPERTGGLFAAMGRQFAQDVKDPLANPGYILMDAFAIGSLGLGATARVGRAAGVYSRMNPGSAAARAIARTAGVPRTTSGALFHAIPPNMRPRINFGGTEAKPRERGNQDPTVPELQDAAGDPGPSVNPMRAFSDRLKRRRAAKELQSLERHVTTRPKEMGGPSLMEQARMRELRREAGIDEPVVPDPSERVAAILAERGGDPAPPPRPSAPPVGRVVPDEQGLAAQQARLAARQERNALAQGQPQAGLFPLPAPTAPGLAARLEARTPYMLPPGREGAIPMGGPDVGAQQLSLPATAGSLRAVGDPRTRAEKVRDIRHIENPTLEAAKVAVETGARKRRPAGASARGEQVAAAAQALRASDDFQQEILDRLGAIEESVGRAPGEGAVASQFGLEAEAPAPAHRPKNEGGMSAPQRSRFNQLVAQNGIQTDFDQADGSYVFRGPKGGIVGRARPVLNDDGTVEMWEDSLSPTGRRAHYEFELHGPGGVHKGHAALDVNRHGRAAGNIFDPKTGGVGVIRRAAAEYLATGRVGVNRPPNLAARATPPLTEKGFAKRSGKKGAEKAREAGETLAGSGYWGAKPKENLGNPEGEGAAELAETRAEKAARKQAEAEAMPDPSDEELAALEAEIEGEMDLTSDDVPQAEKTAKAKAATGNTPLKQAEVDALNMKLDPALANLGMRYDERGYLVSPGTGHLETVLEEAGFDSSEAYLIADALEQAAGDVSKGAKLTPKKIQDALDKNFTDPDEATEMFNRLKGVQGGSGTVWRDVMKALVSPREPVLGSLSARMPARDPETGNRIFVDETFDQVQLSNNPLVRSAWYTVYGALRAFENPYAREGRGNFASRQLRRKMEFERAEIKRIADAGEAAGIHNSVRRYEAEMEKQKELKFSGSPFRIWDTINRGAMMGLLFLKPAYLSANMIGQLGLAMVDHSWNPANVYRTVKFQQELYRDGALAGARAAKIKGWMGEGIIESLDAGPGASKRVFQVHDFTSRQYAKLLDTPFRDNAFINQAWREGVRTTDDLIKLVDAADGTPLNQKAIAIARRANRNMIDYGRLNNIEKQLVRRILIFYPWLKGASIYGARFAAEHPAQFAVATSVGRQGEQFTDEELGMMPSFMRQQGVFKVGERQVPGLGRVPEVMNPAAVSVLGTPGEVINMTRAALVGNVRPSEELAESLTPAATAALTAFTGTDPFTGAKAEPGQSWLGRASESLTETLPFYRQWKQWEKANAISSGELDPREVLYPFDQQDVIGRWAGPGFGAIVGRPLGEFAANPREMRSLATAETRTFQSKRDATMSKYRDYVTRAKDEAKRVGVTLPPAFDQAMRLKAQRDAEVASWEAEHGKSKAHDRLESDMRVLIQRGLYTEADAKQVLDNFARLDENSVNLFRRRLGDAFFGGELRSYYKKLLNAAGAEIDQGW